MKKTKKILSILLVIVLLVIVSPVSHFTLADTKASVESDVAEFMGHRYKLFENGMSWYDAKDACEELGGHLITINSKEENDFIASILESFATKYYYWTAIMYDYDLNSWVHYDGSVVEYQNWAEYNSEDLQSLNEAFVVLSGSNYTIGAGTNRYEIRIGEWFYESSEGSFFDSYGYICEWDDDTEDDIEKQEFINEHIDFVTNNRQYANLFFTNSFYENIWLYEEDSEGKKIISGSIWEYLGDFDELVSFKIDGLTITANPYDLVFFDLINSYNVVESYKQVGLTKYYEKFNEIYDGVMKLFKSTSEWQNDMSDSIKNALTIDIEKFLSTDNYQFSSSDAYGYFCDFLTDSKDNKKIDNIFTGLNLASDVSSYIATAGDIAEVFKDICNAYATAVAFKETDQVFKDILNYCDAMLALDHDRFSRQFSAVLNDYFSIRTDDDAFSYAFNRNLASVVTLAFDTIAKDFFQNSAVTAFATKFNIDKVIASKVLVAYSWTYNILEYVTKTGEKSEVYKLMAAAAHLEKYLYSYNELAKDDLLSKKSLDAAVIFDSSWRMLQSLNGFAYESFAKYIDLEKKATNWKITFASICNFIGNNIKACIYGSDGDPLIAVPVQEYIENELYYKSLESSYVATSLKWRETSCHTKNYDMRKFLSVMCPTEVYIYKNSDLVLSITDTEIVCNDNSISYAVIGSEKYISLPCNEEYCIKITATDNGEMTYNIQEIYEDKTVRFVSYENVQLENGKSYMGNVPTEIYIPSELYNLVSESGSIESADINIYNDEDLLNEGAEKKEPTETEDGYIKTVTDDAEYIIVLHNWTEETVITPTCTNVGKTVVKCTACGETKYYNIVEAAEHNYNENIIAANCTANGYTSHTCTGCGDSYTDNYVDATGHTDNNNDNTCDNCGEKIKQDVDTNCNHICHSNNKFLKFIWNIFNFLMRLFSMEKICSCGAAHY